MIQSRRGAWNVNGGEQSSCLAVRPALERAREGHSSVCGASTAPQSRVGAPMGSVKPGEGHCVLGSWGKFGSCQEEATLFLLVRTGPGVTVWSAFPLQADVA